MEPMDELRALCAKGDVRERLVEIAAVIADALRSVNIDPILVGGGAADCARSGTMPSSPVPTLTARELDAAPRPALGRIAPIRDDGRWLAGQPSSDRDS